MSYCPQCKAEYREDFSMCSDCNIPLVENTKEELEKNNKERWEFFINVYNQEEYAIIQSLLSPYTIPLLTKYKDASGYMQIVMGMDARGTDIFVPSAQLQVAQDLIAEIEFEDDTKFLEFVEEEMEEDLPMNIFSKEKNIKILRYIILGSVLLYILTTFL